MELSTEQLTELKELIRKSGEEATPSGITPAQVASSTFTVNIGGQSYSVSSQEEAQRLFDQLEAQRGQEIESERVKALAAQQRQEQLERTLPRQQAAKDGFDKEEYARLFLEDPRKANKYMLQHDSDQLQFYSGLVNEIKAVKQEAAATQFVTQHKDYESTPENYNAIAGIINQFNLPWDINGMNLAFQVGKAQGLITTSGKNRSTAESDDNDVDETERFTPAPRVSRRRSSQNVETDVLEQFSNLSPDAMKAFLEKNYSQR